MKMFEPSWSLWRSRKQEPPCLPVQEQSAAVLALADRCYLRLPRKPADAAPAALTLYELRVQRGTESWLLQLQAGLWWAAFEASLQSISCSHSPPLPSPHPSTGTITHGLFPSSFLSAQTLHTKVTHHHHFHPGSLWLRCCATAFQSVWMFWSGLFPGSWGFLLKFLSLQRNPWYPPAFTNPERVENSVQFVQT